MSKFKVGDIVKVTGKNLILNDRYIDVADEICEIKEGFDGEIICLKNCFEERQTPKGKKVKVYCKFIPCQLERVYRQ